MGGDVVLYERSKEQVVSVDKIITAASVRSENVENKHFDKEEYVIE